MFRLFTISFLPILFFACAGTRSWPDGLALEPTLSTWTGPRTTTDGVLFIWTNQRPQTGIHLTGSFNAWRMTDPAWKLVPTKPGLWSLLVDLDPGSYMYQYVIDGRTQADPSNTNSKPDGYGGTFSLVIVP